MSCCCCWICCCCDCCADTEFPCGIGRGAGVVWVTAGLGSTTSCFVGFSTFKLFLAPGITASSSSGEQILQPQLSESPLSSVVSHSKCGKKSAGLLKRFLRPVGWPYRYASCLSFPPPACVFVFTSVCPSFSVFLTCSYKRYPSGKSTRMQPLSV